MDELTYIMLKPRKVGGRIRQPGELVPEAAGWKNRSAYLNRGVITATPVESLSDEHRKAFDAWQERVEEPETTTTQSEVTLAERLGSMSIEEIKAKVTAGELDAFLAWEAESEGRQRTTLMSWLEEQAEDEE